MALQPTHEIHKRRFGRNLGVGLLLLALVALTFGLTIVKVSNGGAVAGFDAPPGAAPAPEASAPEASQ